MEYAHGQLIVHRDLKPSNVLVDAHGLVKLLDFGIAKWLAALEDLDASDTSTMDRVLTPSHAAPEQFRGEPTTTATDVYQLGLLLYELVTGRRAHVPPPGSRAALERAVIETDPERPSRVAVGVAAGIRMSPSEVAERARRRAATPVALARRLAGDVDAIVLKALCRHTPGRYATVEALRRDIEACLEHQPKDARGATVLAFFMKLTRRHRAGLRALLALYT